MSELYAPRILKRYWAKVAVAGDDDCWEWLATTDSDGYGLFYLHGKHTKAHRFALALKLGRVLKPGQGECALHSCDNPGCQNPGHLFLGDNQQNTRDRQHKRRQARGETHGCSKLTERKVRFIRDLYETGKWTSYELAEGFGMAQSTIMGILNYQSWRHVR